MHQLPLSSRGQTSREYTTFLQECKAPRGFFVKKWDSFADDGVQFSICQLRDESKLAQLVRAEDCQILGRRFDSAQDWELKSILI